MRSRLLKTPDRSRWDDRKVDHVRPHMERAEREGRFGVVAIVVAQEFQWVVSAATGREAGGRVCRFLLAEAAGGRYYFYMLDPEFGPAFIKICTYSPYRRRSGSTVTSGRNARHEAGIAFTALSNGFASCDDPGRLQAICDTFGPEHVQAFFDRWIAQIPTPLTAEDRAAGYWWELSMRQVEMSRTLVFDDPRRARNFFEALVQDNIGIGRPEEVAMVFARQLRRRPSIATKPGSSPPAPRSKSTSATSTPASSSTSRTAARSGSKRSSTGPTISMSTPPWASPRTDRQSPCHQPAAAYDRAGRPELCHRLCAL